MDRRESQRTGIRLMVPAAATLVLALGFWLPACSAQDHAKDDGGKVVAKVDGKPLTRADLDKSAAEALEQLERKFRQEQHDVLDSQLKQVVQDRLVETEAAARKISKEKLLEEIKPEPVTDAKVDAFYEENKARIPRPKDQVAGQIKQYLEAQGQTEAREKFFKNLEAKYKVEYLLEPYRIPVEAAGFPAKGPASAPVTIVEFSDFQCPFCSRLNPSLEQAKTKYGDKVRIVFRQFPLPMHENAAKAAEAALCAKEQGKFWEMHDAMFKDQSGLAVDALKTKAAGLGLKAADFNSCLDSGREKPAVEADVKDGSKAGVSGTPAMFINGRFINGAVPFEQISQVIDDELRRKGAS